MNRFKNHLIAKDDGENKMLAHDVGPNSSWGCEVRGPVDHAALWQARSTIARQGAAPKIEKKLMAMALGLLLWLPGVARAADVPFTFTTLDVPLPPPAPPNTLSSRTAADGNSANAIAGEYDDLSGATHGFILSGSVYTTIDVPMASYTIINGINAPGQLTGTYHDSSGGIHAFFSPSQGVFTTLTPPGSTRSQGGFLNAQGETVGTYRTSDNKRHGFLWSRGTFIMPQFNVPNDDPVLGTVAFGINELGQIVGDYVDATDHNRHGFLLSNGTYTKPLDPPGSILTVAEGINNAGVIVGVYLDTSFNQHGFLLKDGVYTKIDVPFRFSSQTAINSINPQGQIVGSYVDTNGNTHGFVGTPAD